MRNETNRIISFLLIISALFSVFMAYPANLSYAEDIIAETEIEEPHDECASEESQPVIEETAEASELQAVQVEVQELIQEAELVVENLSVPNLVTYTYPWEGKSDQDFASWVMSVDNSGYVKTILSEDSDAYSEEVVFFKARIGSIEDERLKESVWACIEALLNPEFTVEEPEEILTEEPPVMLIESSEVAEEQLPVEEIHDPPEAETELEDVTGENPVAENLVVESQETENPESIFLIPDNQEEETQIIEETVSNTTVAEEPAEEESVPEYEWNFVDDAEFKAWVLDKQNRKYIRNLTTAADDAELAAEKEAFDRRIEAVAAEEDRLEIMSAVAALSAKLLAAGAPSITYIKGRENAIKFIEDGLIARKTYFELYYEHEGVIDKAAAQQLAKELLKSADGSYIETYSGNGNGSDYLAYQMTAWTSGVAIKEQTSTVTRLAIGIAAQYYDTADEEAQVQQAAADLLSSLGVAGMSSNYDKARAIYMWVVSNVKYGFCSDNPENHPYTAYGALIEKKAVCQGISALTYKLMNDAGVPCRTMASASHNWNAVQIDGAWYIVDATNGTLGVDYYFLIGTDTYSRYQQPMPGYVEMWNSLSKKSYEQATAATTGTICTNVKWTITDNVLTFEPADPTKYSSLATTREEQNKWNADVVDKFYNYIDTIIFNNISDYGGYAPYQDEARIAYGGFPKLKSCIHKGSFPTNPLIYLGLPAAYTVEVPCSWTDANILSMGFSWYDDGPIFKNHTTLNPNGPKIIKAHDFSIAQEPATCTEPGGSILICSYCGEKKETGSSLPALGHNYVEFERKDATCKEAGYVKSKCSRCDDVKTETLKKLDHIKDEGTVITPATCTKEGEISYTCTLCHADLGKEKLEMKEHEYKETSRTEATCEADGKVVSTCDICKGTKEETLKALGHDPKPMPPTETTTGGIQCERCKKILEEPTQGIAVSLAGVGKGETVYINGIPFTASANNQVIIPANMRNVTSASTYSYGSGSGGSYPTGMKVWILSQDNKTGLVTSERASYLDNLMTYSGTSIRLKGNQGIAIHTDINSGTWNSLVGGGYHGYKVQEAGLLVTKTFENETPTYGGSGVIMGKAYDRNGSIRSVNPDGARCYYMNTLVFGNDMEKTKWNLACRPYMIVKDSNGNSITLYGGILVRSVRSVAQQIQPMYKNDKAVSDFINKILSA